MEPLPTFLVILSISTILIGQIEGECCPDKWVRYNDSCYFFGHGMTASFDDAESYCRRNNGHLVHVDDATENAFIVEYLSGLKPADYWLGITDTVAEGVWKYNDTNTELKFIDWAAGEPNSYHRDEDCAAYSSHFHYKWVDLGCPEKYEPLCEKKIVSQTIDILG